MGSMMVGLSSQVAEVFREGGADLILDPFLVSTMSTDSLLGTLAGTFSAFDFATVASAPIDSTMSAEDKLASFEKRLLGKTKQTVAKSNAEKVPANVPRRESVDMVDTRKGSSIRSAPPSRKTSATWLDKPTIIEPMNSTQVAKFRPLVSSMVSNFETKTSAKPSKSLMKPPPKIELPVPGVDASYSPVPKRKISDYYEVKAEGRIQICENTFVSVEFCPIDFESQRIFYKTIFKASL
jgi:hypothetical protein